MDPALLRCLFRRWYLEIDIANIKRAEQLINFRNITLYLMRTASWSTLSPVSFKLERMRSEIYLFQNATLATCKIGGFPFISHETDGGIWLRYFNVKSYLAALITELRLLTNTSDYSSEHHIVYGRMKDEIFRCKIKILILLTHLSSRVFFLTYFTMYQ